MAQGCFGFKIYIGLAHVGYFGLTLRGRDPWLQGKLLKGSWDLVTRVIFRVTILITPIKVLIALFTKSHDPPSRGF